MYLEQDAQYKHANKLHVWRAHLLSGRAKSLAYRTRVHARIKGRGQAKSGNQSGTLYMSTSLIRKKTPPRTLQYDLV